MAVDLLPKVSSLNEKAPTAVLKSQSVKASPDEAPIKVFTVPVVTPSPAKKPTAVLKLSVAVVKF